MDPQESRIDLRALSADRDPAREDRIVVAAAARIRATPVGAPGVVGQIVGTVARLRWPALATASAVAALPIVMGWQSPAAADEPASPSLARAVGVPDQWVGWIVTQQVPTPGELTLWYGEP